MRSFHNIFWPYDLGMALALLYIGVFLDMAAVIYLAAASSSAHFMYQLLDPLWHLPVVGFVAVLLFIVGNLVLVAAMILPLDVKVELEKPGDRLHYNISVIVMSVGPWADLLIQVFLNGWQGLYLERTALMLIGTGVVAMVLATIHRAVSSMKAAITICIIAVLFWLFYYAGAWAVGAMGTPLQVGVWHFLMLSVGAASYRTLKFALSSDSESSSKRLLD